MNESTEQGKHVRGKWNNIGYVAGLTLFSKGCFTLATFLLAINVFLYSTGLVASAKEPMRIMALAALLAAFFLEARELRFSLAELLLLGMLICSVLIHGSGSFNLILVLLYGLVGRRLGQDYAKTILAWVTLVLVILSGAAIVFGLVSDYSYLSDTGRFRRTFGFGHPNYAAIFFSSLFACLLLPKFQKPLPIVLVTCVLLFVGYETDSRGLMACCFVFTLSVICFGLLYRRGFRRLPGVIATTLLLIVAAGSFLLPLFEGTVVDELLSWRPALFASFTQSLSTVDWLIGNPVDEFPIDNFFLVSVASYGLPVLILTLLFVLRAVISLAAHDSPVELAFICGTLSYSVVESFLFRPEFIVTMAFWILVFCNAIGDGRGVLNVPNRIDANHHAIAPAACDGDQLASAGMAVRDDA